MDGIAHYLLDGLVGKLETAIGDMSGRMMTVIWPLASAMLACYIMFWGVSIATGRSQEAFGDGAKRILRVILIIAVAFTADTYQSQVTQFFLEVPPAIAAEVINTGGPTGLAGILDSAMDRGIEVGLDWMRDNNWFAHPMRSLRKFLIGLLICAFTFVLVGIGIAYLVIAFVTLAVLLGMGPLCIMFLIFDQTRRWFDGWLAQIMTFSILFIIVSATCVISFSLVEGYMSDSHEELVGLKILGVLACMIVVMFQTRNLAAAIGGGVSMQTMSALTAVHHGATTIMNRAMGRSGAAASGAHGPACAGTATVGRARARAVAKT
jgi:type IV secretion system protein VirB6